MLCECVYWHGIADISFMSSNNVSHLASESEVLNMEIPVQID